MAAGISAHLQIMLRHTDRVRLDTHAQEHTVYAVISVDLNDFTLSGPPERVAALLRELADKVDADTQTRQAVA